MLRTIAIAAILALTAAAAQAGTTTVRFGDINPAREADSRILSARVQSAALTACSAEWSGNGQAAMFYRQIADACTSRLSQSTMSQIETLLDQRGRVASN